MFKVEIDVKRRRIEENRVKIYLKQSCLINFTFGINLFNKVWFNLINKLIRSASTDLLISISFKSFWNIKNEKLSKEWSFLEKCSATGEQLLKLDKVLSRLLEKEEIE